MNRCLVLPFKEADRVSNFRRESCQRIPANSCHPGIACFDHQMCGMDVERAVGSERLGKMFPAVIEGTRKGKLAIATNQDGALQVSHIEQKKRFFAMYLRVGKFKRVERTDRCELQDFRR